MESPQGCKLREIPRSAAEPSALISWPIGVQIALGMIVIAGAFFLLGRWSHHEPAPVIRREIAGPALDLNRATRAELRLLPGLGDALAQRVIDHRQQTGPFRSVEDLRQVPGIGPKTLDRLRPHFFVNLQESYTSLDDDGGPPVESKPRASTISKKASLLTAPININHANQAELQKLPGIGPKLSQRILDARATAFFKSIEDLRRVPGIGAKTLAKLRPHITVE